MGRFVAGLGLVVLGGWAAVWSVVWTLGQLDPAGRWLAVGIGGALAYALVVAARADADARAGRGDFGYLRRDAGRAVLGGDGPGDYGGAGCGAGGAGDAERGGPVPGSAAVTP